MQIDRLREDDDDSVVRSYAREAAPEAAILAPYRGQQAAVVVWGMHADHRQAVVSTGSYQRMRREAVNATRDSGVDTRHMVADIAPAAPRDRAKRRPVVVALARTYDITAALRPIEAAGIRVRSLVTPALALMSLARMRRRLIAPGTVEAYVAFEETSTAIALMRDAALVAARELEWGYLDAGEVRSRDDIVERLGVAVEEFLDDCGARPSAIAQVCVCGGMPELRSMTLALTERLDVEVEPLDSLFGIDPDRLPDPMDDFRDRMTDLRLAWAVAADWHAPINLLRERRRRVAKTVFTRAAVVAGVATGVAVAWRIQGSDWLQSAARPRRVSSTRPSAPRAAAVSPRSRPSKPAAPVSRVVPQVVQAPPGPVPAVQSAPAPKVVEARPLPAPLVVATPPPARAAATAIVERRQPQPQLQPRPQLPVVETRAPMPQVPVPSPAPRQARPAVAAPLVLTPVPEPQSPASTRNAATPVVPPREVRATAPVARPAPPEEAQPFDATLGTILYGADRKLAIVDGHIVQVGDEVRGARVVEITATAVLFRDRQGRLRKLSLDGEGR